MFVYDWIKCSYAYKHTVALSAYTNKPTYIEKQTHMHTDIRPYPSIHTRTLQKGMEGGGKQEERGEKG